MFTVTTNRQENTGGVTIIEPSWSLGGLLDWQSTSEGVS